MAIAGVVVACGAAIGVLYLLRNLGVLDAGPAVSGALPLEQLAHRDAQPLARMAAAWVPAGLVAGAALRWAGVERRAARAAVSLAVAAPLLVLAGAASDAAAISAGIVNSIQPQFGRAGTWVAVGMFVIGALAAGVRAPRREVE